MFQEAAVRRKAAKRQPKTDTILTMRRKLYSCTHCHEKFRNLNRLISHSCKSEDSQASKKTRAVTYTCKFCGEKFSKYGLLRDHKKTHAAEEEAQRKKDEEENQEEAEEDETANTDGVDPEWKPESGEKLYECKVCGDKFRGMRQLMRHRDTHFVIPRNLRSRGKLPDAKPAKEEKSDIRKAVEDCINQMLKTATLKEKRRRYQEKLKAQRLREQKVAEPPPKVKNMPSVRPGPKPGWRQTKERFCAACELVFPSELRLHIHRSNQHNVALKVADGFRCVVCARVMESMQKVEFHLKVHRAKYQRKYGSLLQRNTRKYESYALNPHELRQTCQWLAVNKKLVKVPVQVAVSAGANGWANYRQRKPVITGLEYTPGNHSYKTISG